MKSIVLSSTFLFLSVSVFADVCITNSHGLSFQGINDDSVQAASAATEQCSANRFAEASECSQNLTCDANLAPIYTSGEITCWTQSREQAFEARDADINVASASAFDQCMSDSSSDSSECTTQLTCYDSASSPVAPPVPGPVLPYVYCGTQSRGHFFHSEGYGDSVARGDTIQQCTSAFGTDPAECFRFISCALTPGGVRVAAPVARPRPPIVIVPPHFPPRRPPVMIRPGRPGRGPRFPR